MTTSNNLVINRVIIMILLCYPVLLLTVKGGMNSLFFLLVITSFFYLFRTSKSLAIRLWDGYSIAFAFAMASPMLAVFFSQAYYGAFRASQYDGPSRFLFAIPIFLALRQMEIRTLSFLQFALPLGVLAAFLGVVITQRDWTDHTYFVNSIHFGNLALMLGFLSLFSINWANQDRKPVLILKLCGFIAGLYLSVQSGARGGWVAIPLLLYIWWMSHNPKFSWPKLATAVLTILLIILLSYAFIGTVQHRMDLIYQDLVDFQQGYKDTSTGIRLQLWQAACYLFAEHPLFGVGPDGFSQMMGPLTNSGMLTTTAADYGRGEVHNEILAKAAGLGIFGLMSIISIYAVPFAIFMRSTRSSVAQTRKAAFMGICLVTGFFIFGLTVEIFNLKMTDSFYSLTLAVLLAAATHKTSN